MRLFVGLALPPGLRRSLFHQLGPLRRRYQDLKWVKPDNFHVTMLFIGEADDSLVAAVRAGLEEDGRGLYRPFEVELGSAGQFPGRGPARIVHVGLAAGGPECVGLYRVIETRLREHSPVAGRRFTPHVTVARSRGKGPSLSPADVSTPFEGRFRVERVTLFESILLPTGSEYRVLSEYAL